jgi:glycosyltransferase involved in cell wall biosynthesis
MFRNRVYYRIKPLLPRGMRMSIRKLFAARKRDRVQNCWPILRGTERAPEGWPGWPDEKQFALVLTHDVEGRRGLERCLQLMRIEAELGFRSSFNLIPEGGDYTVPKELVQELQRNGFEVGVHDLHHDGNLYDNRHAFSKKAARINHYLQEWNSVGFRSGFMLRNLEWLHDLNISYDASTFDTDPFEPQPDGANTIFPFWVPGLNHQSQRELSSDDNRSGYVELPYTLPQDSTLFRLLGEKSARIWIEKADWIATHGGMALVNVHPDYIRFDGEPASPHTYPVQFYVDFLRHMRARYANALWNALPREVATHFSKTLIKRRPPTPGSGAANPSKQRVSLNGKRAAVILYSGFPSDPRPRRELEALVERGMFVDLICLAEDAEQPRRETIGLLTVTRIPIQHKRSGKIRYFWDYARFFLHAFRLLTMRSTRRHYDLVHVHNMPDFLVFTAVISRLLGARVILDLHDPMPELYQTIYGLQKNAVMVRMLKSMEKWSIGFAHLVLTPNEAFRKLFCSRSCPDSKVKIVMNTPDEKLFHLGQANPEAANGNPAAGEFRLMYHGLIAERHGLSTAIQAVKVASTSVDNLVLEIYGKRNAYLDQIVRMAEDLQLNGSFRYCGKRRIDDIPAAILDSDLGVIPNCRTPFTEINFPTRIFEYLCLGKAVIVPRTSGIQDYFSEDSIIFFEPDNAQDLSNKIYWAYSHPTEVQAIVARGQKVYEQHRWAVEKHVFFDLVEDLLTTKPH